MTKRKRKSDLDKIFDAIDMARDISANINETIDKVKDMLGLDDTEVLLARERFLDNEIARLQGELYNTRRVITPPVVPCPKCGGPHKSYECDRPAKEPAPQPMTIERAVSIMGLNMSDIDKNPKECLQVLRKQYRELAQIWHPDVGGTDQKMLEINTAYRILKEIIEKNEKSRGGGSAGGT